MSALSISLAPALPLSRSRLPAARPAADDARPQGFARGTQVRTIFGLRRVEAVMAGDLLLDAQGQIVELRAIRQIKARPRDLVRLDPSAMGLGCAPGRLDRALVVGAGQKLAMRDWRTDVLFGKAAMTQAAKLIDGQHVHQHPGPRVLYELTFDRDCVIEADGLKALVRGQASQAKRGRPSARLHDAKSPRKANSGADCTSGTF